MPFHGYTPIPASDGTPLKCAAILSRWHAGAGDCLEPNAKVATVQIGDQAFDLLICFSGGIEKCLVVDGELVQPSQDILRWGADGENIPYKRAYFRTQPEA